MYNAPISVIMKTKRMKQEVEEILAVIIKQLASFESVEAVSSADSEDADILHPYFFISLDVFTTAPLDGENLPRSYHPDQYAFESSLAYVKDRFMVNNVPIRLEYKTTSWVESLLSDNQRSVREVCKNGTYTFHRLSRGETLFSRTGWIENIKSKLMIISDEKWSALCSHYRSASDHDLGDMSAAVLTGDLFFFNLSLAGFVRNITRLLLAVNRGFEPSGRKIDALIFTLPVLPEHFKGRYDALLRCDADLDPPRKREVAELLAKSVYCLVS